MKKAISLFLSFVLAASLAVIPASAVNTKVNADEFLYNAVLNYETTVDTKGLQITYNELEQAKKFLHNACPDCFHFLGMEDIYIMGDYVTTFKIIYKYSKEEVDWTVSEIEKRFLNGIDKNWTDEEKVTFVHDKIAADFQYDIRLFNPKTAELVARDIYRFVKDGQGVCQAYSNLFKYIMDKIGIESKLIASNSANHEWNVVKLDGQWYHIDVTQDDPVLALETGTVSEKDRAGTVNHNYFLLSDKKIEDKDKPNGHHYEWYSLDGMNVTCTSDKYSDNYNFYGSVTSFVPIENDWYFIEVEKRAGDTPLLHINKTNDFMNKETVVTMPAVWAAETEFSYWPGAFTGLSGVKDFLIYNTDTEIKAYNVKTKETKVIETLEEIRKNSDFSLDGKSVHIYGSKLTDEGVYYSVSVQPAASKYYTSVADLCKKSHLAVGEFEVIEEATCLKPSLLAKKCLVCGKIIETKNGEAAKGHNFVKDEEQSSAPTCTEKGKIVYKCSRCGEVKTEEISALGHDWVTDKEKSYPAETGKPGLKVEYCSRHCGVAIRETVIPALSESVAGDCNGDKTVNASDLAILKKSIAGLIPKNESHDCNKDNAINASDLALLKKFIAGLIASII